MSFEELAECLPLDVAFDELRDKAREYYAAKASLNKVKQL